MLNGMSVRSTTVNGSGPRVESILDRFRRGDIDVLMLNATHFGSGLNLQMATDVVLFHRMPEHVSQQIVGRAQRFGRDTHLNVWHLLHGNEINSPTRRDE